MKTFLEEYGIAIFVIACIIILITIASPVGAAVRDAILKVVNTFTDDTSIYSIKKIDLSGATS